MASESLLASWNDTATTRSIVDYVTRVTTEGSDFVAPDERIATFDNDGTLWCEKPLPIELAFILERLAAMATDDATLRTRQPWKAAYEKDYGWLGAVMTKHYEGDDSDVKVLMGGVIAAFAGLTVDEYEAQAGRFIREGVHPTNGRSFLGCGYRPMVELLRYLEANGFTTVIASGGDRDFMRSIAQDVYSIPPERVVGSSNALQYDDDAGTLAYLAEPDVFDDGPVKPVRIWSRVGRRPIVAGGNSNGDIPMLGFAGGSNPALRLLLLHDDAEREFDYTGGSETALQRADTDGWTVISMRDDWSEMFHDVS
jgi:phosphoserine phosphatase